MNDTKILIIDDDSNVTEVLKSYFENEGYDVKVATDGMEGLNYFKIFSPDLVLLDVMLPGLSGFEVIKQIPKTPVIFVTAKTSLNDKLAGLYLGGDDYIVKPFEILELIARVESVLRRTCAAADEFTVDDVTVNYSTRKVTKDGRDVYLTPREFSLLETLIINRNIALSREKLIDLVWASDFDGDPRTVDVHIQRLRTKLGLENRIKTIYRLGYRFEI